ncbi:hypothetical protein T05_10116 [Trichinella murrelli]|uniref:Uncharacterized protein n=1 Tax=Trichinella murrelli TaxID=144512 RepID=A0A0V0TA05_9BILA|nr:hypothetical protein T05_10116 [Trichinella murrelli]
MKLKSLPTLKYPTVVVIGSFLQTALPFFEKCDNYGPNFTLHTLPRHFSEIFSKSILLPSVQILDIPGPSTSTVLIKYLCETLLLSYASDGCEYLKHLSF